MNIPSWAKRLFWYFAGRPVDSPPAVDYDAIRENNRRRRLREEIESCLRIERNPKPVTRLPYDVIGNRDVFKRDFDISSCTAPARRPRPQIVVADLDLTPAGYVDGDGI
jgi:hypothetical protein